MAKAKRTHIPETRLHKATGAAAPRTVCGRELGEDVDLVPIGDYKAATCRVCYRGHNG